MLCCCMLLKDQRVPQPGLPFRLGDPWQLQLQLIPQPDLPPQRPFRLGDPWQLQTIVQPQSCEQPPILSRTAHPGFSARDAPSILYHEYQHQETRLRRNLGIKTTKKAGLSNV